ncbi:hypothetical protein CDL12_05508 [Handroanthus impetiginosus]|uniref:Myb/SANT-like domain-containing protein n=1 Tax=Handroanthus impetiginosus TaxID=429701 RepID=A0A2G9HWB6_9LAMI|nr:hypothetical protein CDL12_05508 [Handroanthus impetiginosus]
MMHSVISSKSIDRSTKAPSEPRCFWTPHEDETLIKSLKKLQAEGCDLHIKHIKSKLQVWKKTYATFLGILSISGGAGATMDPNTHTIVAENELVWDEYVKVHYIIKILVFLFIRSTQKGRFLKNRPQPMYNSWFKFFGTNRVTGVGSIDVVDIVTEMLNETRAPNVEFGTDDTIQPPYCSVREGAQKGAEYDALSTEATSGSTSKKKTNLLGRQKIMGDTKEVLSSIANQLNHPKQTQAEMNSPRRTALLQALCELPVLSLDDRIKATHHLAHNKGNMDAFWGMDKEVRGHFVMMLLGTNFGVGFCLSIRA